MRRDPPAEFQLRRVPRPCPNECRTKPAIVNIVNNNRFRAAVAGRGQAGIAFAIGADIKPRCGTSHETKNPARSPAHKSGLPDLRHS